MWRSTNVKNRTSLHHERQRQSFDDFGAFEFPRGRQSFNRSHDARNHTSQGDAQRRSLLRLHARMRQDISQTAGVLLNDVGEATSASPDTADLARELSEQDVAVSLLDSASDTVDQIQAALDRIDEGSYGFCEDCGARIPEERLAVLPYAAHCVQCAARREAETAQ
jgi:DnaK suppressor protein